MSPVIAKAHFILLSGSNLEAAQNKVLGMNPALQVLKAAWRLGLPLQFH